VNRLLQYLTNLLVSTRNFNFFYIFSFATLSFWLMWRQGIWHQHQLFPSERVDIYLRDGAAFYTWHRLVFATLYLWAFYHFYQTKKVIYPWLSVAFFVVLSMADTTFLYYHYTDYLTHYPDWMGAIDNYHFKYLAESVLALLINFFILRLMTTPRIKSIQNAFN
jgi:hypothetical protein